MTRCQMHVSTTQMNCSLLVWSKPGRPGTRGVSSQVSGHENQVGGIYALEKVRAKMLEPNAFNAGTQRACSSRLPRV